MKEKMPYQSTMARSKTGGTNQSVVRWFALGSLMLLAFLAYLNFTFHMNYSNNSSGKHGQNAEVTQPVFIRKDLLPGETMKALTPQELSAKIQSIIYTSTCSALDMQRAYVLAFTVRETGFTGGLTHIIYNCPENEFNALPKRELNVDLYHTKTVSTDVKEVNPLAILEWMQNAPEFMSIKKNEFITIVEIDTIFTKLIDMQTLYSVIDGIDNPRCFGQDAAWYRPEEQILPLQVLEKIVGKDSKVLRYEEWRNYAVHAPFVIERNLFPDIITKMSYFYPKLEPNQKHFAYPLAVGELEIPQAIVGILRISRYNSFAENWNFVDETHFNPCNESTDSLTMQLESYPLTLRTSKLELPAWADGSHYNMIDELIPSDFFHCDSWMLMEPPTVLWRLASNTNGWEGLSLILRRRHTMAVALATKSYNRAAIHYKLKHCRHGYNTNKKLLLQRNNIIPSALANSPANVANLISDPKTVVYYGENGLNQTRLEGTTTTMVKVTNQPSLHFVFATTCSGYQNWLVDFLVYSAKQVKQEGTFTRILSGCIEQEIKAVKERYDDSFLNFFVTADFKDHPYPHITDVNYTPYNKPFGIRDWLRHANPPVSEDIIVIIDPDFVFLKPFTVNSNRTVVSKTLVRDESDEYFEIKYGLKQRKPNFVYSGYRSTATINDRVVKGTGIAQTWVAYLGSLAFTKARQNEVKELCPKCNVSEQDAREYYAVGPPYALAKSDLDLFIDDYCNITVKMRQSHPDLWMAENHGYSVAAAKHGLKHTRLDNLAVTQAEEGEYWTFSEDLTRNPCLNDDTPIIPIDAPTFIHGCKSYYATDKYKHEWRYYKQIVPEDVFACDSWMLEVPDESVWEIAKQSNEKEQLHLVYGLCTSIKMLNNAILNSKRKNCLNGYNSNKKLRLVSPRPNILLNVGNVPDEWATITTY